MDRVMRTVKLKGCYVDFEGSLPDGKLLHNRLDWFAVAKGCGWDLIQLGKDVEPSECQRWRLFFCYDPNPMFRLPVSHGDIYKLLTRTLAREFGEIKTFDEDIVCPLAVYNTMLRTA